MREHICQRRKYELYNQVHNYNLTVNCIIMDAPLRQFYEKKIQRLQIDNFQLQEELYSRPTDQYKLKYQLLLQKVAEQNHLRESKRTQQNQYNQKAVADINHKWEGILQAKTNQLKGTIEQLQNQNKFLSIKNTQLQLKSVRLQRQIDEGDSEIFKLKSDGLKKENQRLRKEISESYNDCERQVNQIKKDAEERIEQTKERQKICYRTQIQDLQKKIMEILQELQLAKLKASPERQINLQQFQMRVLRDKQQQAQQILKIASVLQSRNKEINSIKEAFKRKEEFNSNTIRQLSEKLKKYGDKLFQCSLDKQMALLQLKKQLDGKRQKQAEELKQELNKTLRAFDRQRQQWRQIISQFENENKKIKKNWQQEKQKYVQQKNRLKQKIGELRKRLKDNQEGSKQQNQRLLKSLRDIQSNQQHFTNYENGITFMDRQVRKSSIKIKQQDIEINNLLGELKTLQQQSQKEIAYTREKSRQQVKHLYDNIFALQDQSDQLQVQFKQIEKTLKKKEKDIESERAAHREEISNYKKIIEEMQRDYQRVTSHQKSLQDSYREERENVITGKLDMNQQRKKKWTELTRQKNELELVFRERQAQLRHHYQVQMDKLKRQKHEALKDRESHRAEIQLLKERLGEKQNLTPENSYSDYQAKLASLDLEIALTQNLFKSLAKATAKKQTHRKTQLEQLNQEDSQKMSSDGHQLGEDLMQFGSFEASKEDPFRNVGFSFCPPNKL